MNQNWIQGDIAFPVETRSSSSTPERHSQTGKNVNRNHLPKLTPWEAAQKIWGENQVNDINNYDKLTKMYANNIINHTPENKQEI